MPHPSPALSFPRAPAPTRGWLFVALAIVLVLVRLPSLAEPAGADQGLYGYVGQRILDGGVPYRDAWDQKPPAIHYTYAVLFALWSNEAVINIADLAAVIGTAWGLYVLGRGLAPLTPAGPWRRCFSCFSAIRPSDASAASACADSARSSSRCS